MEAVCVRACIRFDTYVWAGEPDGTQSGISKKEMTVRRPTIDVRLGCQNPRCYANLV